MVYPIPSQTGQTTRQTRLNIKAQLPREAAFNPFLSFPQFPGNHWEPENTCITINFGKRTGGKHVLGRLWATLVCTDLTRQTSTCNSLAWVPWHKFTHSFTPHPLNAYHVPGIVLGTGDTVMIKTPRKPCFDGLWKFSTFLSIHQWWSWKKWSCNNITRILF